MSITLNKAPPKSIAPAGFLLRLASLCLVVLAILSTPFGAATQDAPMGMPGMPAAAQLLQDGHLADRHAIAVKARIDFLLASSRAGDLQGQVHDRLGDAVPGGGDALVRRGPVGSVLPAALRTRLLPSGAHTLGPRGPPVRL